MRDLVVIDKVHVDRGRAAPHLLDHEGGGMMAQEDIRRRALSRVSFGWFATMRRCVFLSHQRKPGMPSLLPWRTPAWLAEVCVGKSGSQRSRVMPPEPSHRARLGARPARSCSSRIG